jgi:hypothetical protein
VFAPDVCFQSITAARNFDTNVNPGAMPTKNPVIADMARYRRVTFIAQSDVYCAKLPHKKGYAGWKLVSMPVF